MAEIPDSSKYPVEGQRVPNRAPAPRPRQQSQRTTPPAQPGGTNPGGCLILLAAAGILGTTIGYVIHTLIS
jgi:hypothetical protein